MFEKLDRDDKIFLSALAAIREEKYDEAIGALHALLEENPQDCESLLLLADCHTSMGDYLEALIALKEAHKLEPKKATILSSLGAIYTHFHIHEMAINALKEAIDLGQKEEGLYSNLARAYFLSGALEEAKKVLEEGLQINPSWNELHHRLGFLYLYTKNTEQALQIAKLLEQRKYPSAAEFLQTITEDSPEKDRITTEEYRRKAQELIQHAKTLLTKGKAKEAAQELVVALDSDFELAIAYTQLGFILDQYGLIDEGLALHKQAVRIDPSYAWAYNNLGYVLNVKGEYEEAIKAYEKALEIEPGRFTTLTNLGYVYRALGEIAKALAAYQKASQLYPEVAFPRISMGSIYQEMEKYDEAEREYLAALEKDPQSLGVWIKLALCYLAKEDSEKFREAVEKITSFRPQRPEELFLMAGLVQRFDEERAIQYWREYIAFAERYPVHPESIAIAKANLAKLIGPTY